jgi:myo-inositol-1(or 4)-monophosphatase
MTRSALINVMTQAVRKAARPLVRDLGELENLQVSRKGPGDFVTASDRKVERTLREELEKARPGYGFLMEETGAIEGADRTHRWIIDPIDGTTNFMHGIPMFALSIALERDGELVAGVTYNPAVDELFVAEKGKGAFLNDRRLRVAARSDLADAVVCCGIPHIGRGDYGVFLSELAAVQPAVAGIRRTGSAALDLAWVAAGRFDGFWERGLSPWDMAAGIVLVREAGGLATDLDNRYAMLTTGDILVANDRLHPVLHKLVKGAGRE